MTTANAGGGNVKAKAAVAPLDSVSKDVCGEVAGCTNNVYKKSEVIAAVQNGNDQLSNFGLDQGAGETQLHMAIGGYIKAISGKILAPTALAKCTTVRDVIAVVKGYLP